MEANFELKKEQETWKFTEGSLEAQLTELQKQLSAANNQVLLLKKKVTA